jgi:hypothetical protein
MKFLALAKRSVQLTPLHPAQEHATAYALAFTGE